MDCGAGGVVLASIRVRDVPEVPPAAGGAEVSADGGAEAIGGNTKNNDKGAL